MPPWLSVPADGAGVDGCGGFAGFAGAVVAAGRYRLAAGWVVLLTLSLPSIGAAGLRAGTAHPLFWNLVIDAQGLTAVAAVLLLPWLLRAPDQEPALSAELGPSRR